MAETTETKATTTVNTAAMHQGLNNEPVSGTKLVNEYYGLQGIGKR